MTHDDRALKIMRLIRMHDGYEGSPRMFREIAAAFAEVERETLTNAAAVLEQSGDRGSARRILALLDAGGGSTFGADGLDGDVTIAHLAAENDRLRGDYDRGLADGRAEARAVVEAAREMLARLWAVYDDECVAVDDTELQSWGRTIHAIAAYRKEVQP